MPENVRVRFAPSPTGLLHIGGARTAIYNWAFARRMGGTFILRIDDTDPERSTDENVRAILAGLRWMGLDWDEGPEAGGDFGPYYQTQRGDTYGPALDRMKANGSAYPCFCTAEDLAAKRDAARENSGAAGYDRTCRRLDPEKVASRIAAGEPHVWRLAVPEDRGDVVFTDAIRGELAFPAASLDDFVLVRTDGTPTYNFATVIDDELMEISHVVRGDDHLSNTPRQILVFEALGHEPPVFAHLSMIWGADGKKLSKRHGAASVEEYRDAGYLPEAVLNYLALLGWSLDGETTVFDAETLCKNFSFDRVSSNPAIFDVEKLDWLNGAYIRELAPSDFVDRIIPWLVSAGLAAESDLQGRREWLLGLAPLVSVRVKRLDEVAATVAFLFGDGVGIDPAIAEKVLGVEGVGIALDDVAETLGRADPYTHDVIEEALRAVPERVGLKPKVVFQAVRVAVTGSTVSPPLFESLELLGLERTLSRIAAARALAG
ncbi:MAG: glutamate--tRNA ligase [Coriobacteriia bacterium]|nr:glutamate--tRNA ligase [Coriobacteriia bacterium]